MDPDIIYVINVIPGSDGKWHIRDADDREVCCSSADKNAAVDSGRKLARERHGQLVVQKRDGAVDFAEDFAAVER